MRTNTIQIEWHLTPRGWEVGEWSAGGPLKAPAVPPPKDRIETWIKTEIFHAVSFALLKIKWSLIWISPHQSETDRKLWRTQTRTVAAGLNNPSEVFGEFPLEEDDFITIYGPPYQES